MPFGCLLTVLTSRACGAVSGQQTSRTLSVAQNQNSYPWY